MNLRGNRPLGLAIEQTGIRYVRLNNKKNWGIARKGMLSLPKGMIVDNHIADRQGLGDLLHRWVKKEGLRGSQVSLSIPPTQVIIRKMTIPSTNRKQLDQLVRLEVETGLHLPFDHAVYDYIVTDTDDDSTQLLVFAAPGNLIDSYIELLHEAGLKVQNIEISATALARAVVLRESLTFSDTMLIHLDRTMLDVYLFHAGHPLFLRTINLYDLTPPPGEPSFWNDGRLAQEAAASAEMMEPSDESVVDQLSAEQLVEITAEISRMLNFYQYSLHDGSTRITEVIVTGPVSGRRQLLRELNQMLPDMDIQSALFEEKASRGLHPGQADLNDYRIALGAALSGRGVSDLHLMPREDREAQLFPYIVLALVAVWLIGMSGMGWWYATSRGDNEMLAEQIQGVRDQKAALQMDLASINSGGAASNDPQQVVDEILANRMDAVAVLDDLDVQLPQGAVIRNISYTQYGDIMLSVNILRMEDAAAYLTELENMPFARKATIDKLTEEQTVQAGGAAADAGTLINKPKYAVMYKISTSRLDSAAASAKEGNHAGEDQP
ncbi:hypothetical protein GRF59_23870 [Paenibacillus sp. HJL G12]|uniref:Pilus assembly protein PilM n=1 Tax=Paenibacillus dendrobii TaxID=2691084 RepID=A0A7X3INQ0_9BACL|nr:pilus assembly protein PilM [Paenibacillus dendrobii]MWV46651.1 hypothetical protein [Paenibacillus dendrobii]